VLLQRVSNARVEVDDAVTGAIGKGLLLLVGVAPTDGEDEITALTSRIVNLRIFEDQQGRMNRSSLDLLGAGEECGMLVISQFTLYGDVRKGRRPSFTGAAAPEAASPLIERFVEMLRGHGFPVGEGVFGAHMMVTSTNDGPVTIWLDSENLHRSRRAGLDTTL
jgi:D-tyrosyl-tRNA(Tyr) deacylase